MKTLISWMAKTNDFKEGEVNEDGPNFTYHKFYYEHDQHILLCSEQQDDTAFEFLLNSLLRKYSGRKIIGEYLGIKDVINLEEIMVSTREILLKYKDDEIDIFFSPGTSIMQLSWFILHSTLGLNTRLLQLREARLSKNKKPEKLLLEADKSLTPITATLKQFNINKKNKDFLITERLKPSFDRALKVAKAGKVSVHITGETGTGKEVVARYIHKHSHRRDDAFIAINCSAFSDSLLESRLFGHRKGSFTDAKSDQVGLFKQADGGTLFLDEIGDISPYMQQSLLRVLQEKEIHPIGGQPQKIDVQLITATNKNLVNLCGNGKYRWDLYYRLAVAEIEIPSLRERGVSEVEAMLSFFIKKKKADLNMVQSLQFEKEAWEKLKNYHFPGNVRELENIIEGLYVFAEDKVSIKDLPERIRCQSGSIYLLSEFEKEHILKVTEIFDNKRMQAAEALGISYNTYKKKMKKFN